MIFISSQKKIEKFILTFLRMLTREARMMAAKTQTGRGWKSGPRANMTTSKHSADTRLVNILLQL